MADYEKKATEVAKLNRYMMFATEKGQPIGQDTPRLLPSVVGESKLGMVVFDRTSGSLVVTSFNFYLHQFDAFIQEAIALLKSQRVGKDSPAKAIEVTMVATRPAVDSKPDRATEGRLVLTKDAGDMVTLKLETPGKRAPSFIFAPMYGNSTLVNGKERETRSLLLAEMWLVGLYKAAGGVANLLAFKAAKSFGGGGGGHATPVPTTAPPATFEDDIAF